VDKRTIGWILLGGAAAVGVGAVIYFNTRKTKERVFTGPLGKSMPDPVGKFTDEGYVLTEYRKKDLPIEERVAILQDMIHKSVQVPSMRKLSLQVTKKCKARDTACESRAIHDWIEKNIRYTGDIAPHKLGRHGPVEGVDLFQRADRTVEFEGGDCDDHVVANCTMAILNGIPCRVKVTSPNKGKKDDYAHVYAMHGVPKNSPRRWVPSDTTLPGKNSYGIEAPHGKSLTFIG
jgi:hypothetical protein